MAKPTSIFTETKAALTTESVGLARQLICWICYVNVSKLAHVLNTALNYWHRSYNYSGCYRLINLE